MTIAAFASLRFTRCARVPSPDRNREWAGSGIDRPHRRPVAFAFPTAIGAQKGRPPSLLLCSSHSSAVLEARDAMEDRRW